MAFLNRRWGSGVIRHIDASGERLKEFGITSFRGFSCWWSVMNFLVVRMSQIGSASEEFEDNETGSETRRFLVEVEAAIS